MSTLARFQPAGRPLAIEPQAVGIECLIAPPRAPYAMGSATVLEINGPITHAAIPPFDCYAGVAARFDAALSAAPATIILKLNSPGGDVAGAFDLSRYMRAAAAAAGKRLIAFTETHACSSAYALASAAERIACSSTATLGSIGVIACLEDRSALNTAAGLRYSVVTSGARKADGNPNLPISDAALAAIQQSVDAMAGEFFALVAAHRELDAQPLQAGTFVGHAAVEAKLADEVLSWFELAAQFKSTPAAESPPTEQDRAAGELQALSAKRDALQAEIEAVQSASAIKRAQDIAHRDRLRAYQDQYPKDSPMGLMIQRDLSLLEQRIRT